MKSGIGRQREVHHRTTLLRTTWPARVAAQEQHGADDIDGDERERHRHAENRSTVEPPRSSSAAISQDMGQPSCSGRASWDGRGSGRGHDAETASLRGARSRAFGQPVACGKTKYDRGHRGGAMKRQGGHLGASSHHY
jgi:hypothetical protein